MLREIKKCLFPCGIYSPKKSARGFSVMGHEAEAVRAKSGANMVLVRKVEKFFGIFNCTVKGTIGEVIGEMDLSLADHKIRGIFNRMIHEPQHERITDDEDHRAHG